MNQDEKRAALVERLVNAEKQSPFTDQSLTTGAAAWAAADLLLAWSGYSGADREHLAKTSSGWRQGDVDQVIGHLQEWKKSLDTESLVIAELVKRGYLGTYNEYPGFVYIKAGRFNYATSGHVNPTWTIDLQGEGGDAITSQDTKVPSGETDVNVIVDAIVKVIGPPALVRRLAEADAYRLMMEVDADDQKYTDAHMKDVLSRVLSIMDEQMSENDEPFREGNEELYDEIAAIVKWL